MQRKKMMKNLNLIILQIVKIFKKEFKTNNIKVILGVIITIIYLGIGTYLNYHIFETKYEIYNDKGVNLRIIQIADSHVGTTFDGNGFYKEMEKLNNDQKVYVTLDKKDYVESSVNKAETESKNWFQKIIEKIFGK